MAVDDLVRQIEEICRESLQNSTTTEFDADELRRLLGDLYEALDDAAADTKGISSYVEEKFNGLKSFALMAVGAYAREGYGATQIMENVSHFGYLVRTRS